jgi:hypothetical protein
LDSKTKISRDGGNAPFWSASGREIFYWSLGSGVLRAEIEYEPVFKAGIPVVVLEDDYEEGDIAPDGRFLMTKRKEAESNPSATHIHIILNWAEELKRMVSTTQ